MVAAPFNQAAPRPQSRAPLDLDAQERRQFYDLLWGNAEGYAYVVAGLPGDDILARGWPLAEDESVDPDKVMLLVYSRATFDAFKAAGRPHEGKVFAWPREARALDRYAAELGAKGYNVYTRKYLGATEQAAKKGDAPTVAAVVVVEDAPAEPGALAPPYSFMLQTSEYSQQAFYRLTHPLPWGKVQALAEAARLRLGADSGGPNPAQLTRIPTFCNTKRKAGRARVRLVAGAGEVLPAELARAVGYDLAASKGSAGAAREQRGSTESSADPAAWAAVEDYRGHLKPGGLLRRADGTLKRPKAEHASAEVLRNASDTATIYDRWATVGAALGRDASKTGWRYYLAETLRYYGYPQVEARALLEALAPEGTADPRTDIDRVLAKNWADHPGITENPTKGYTPAPAPAPELPTRPRRGRPVGARVCNVERLAAELARRLGELVTRGALAEVLALTPRSITTHLRTLAQAGRLDLLPGPRGLTVVRVENKSAPAPVPASAQQDALEAVAGWIINQGAEGGNKAPFEASQCGADLHGDHAPPVPPPCPAPAAVGDAPALDLSALLAEGLRTLGQLLDPDTGELRRVRVDAALLRAWIAQQAPTLDTTAIEQLLPGARALVDAERRRDRAAGEWAAERVKVRALADTALLVLCKRRASRHASAVKRGDTRAAWYGALAAVADGERRRRGLDLAALDAEAQGQRPRRGRRQDFDARRVQQQDQAARRADLLGLFDARAHDPVTSAPAAAAHQAAPPDDGAPHPAEGANSRPKSTGAPSAPSAGAGVAERLRVVAARPRVALAQRPDAGPTLARPTGYSAAEADAALDRLDPATGRPQGELWGYCRTAAGWALPCYAPAPAGQGVSCAD